MTTLKRIQKVFRIAQNFVRIVMIGCIIGAAVSCAAALCAVKWGNGGQVFTLFGKTVSLMELTGDCNGIMVLSISNCAVLSAHTITLGFADTWLRYEQETGTPFTFSGSKQLQKLGVCWGCIPVVTSVLVSVIRVCSGIDVMQDVMDPPFIGTGILMILVAMIFRYGAEMRKDADQSAFV